MDGQTDIQMGRWMDGWTDECSDGYTVWMDGWADVYMDRWTDGWMDGQLKINIRVLDIDGWVDNV